MTITPPKDFDLNVAMWKIPKGVTFRGAVARYLKYLRRRDLSRVYIRQSRFVLRRLERMFEHDHIGRLTQRQIRRALRSIYFTVAPNTYAHYSRIYRLFFDFCQRQDLVAFNFVREFKLKYYRTLMFLTPAQLDLIFRGLPPGELRDACLLMYGVPLLRTELAKIVGIDWINHRLILTDRRVPCDPLTLKIVERRRRYSLNRVMKQFHCFRKRLDFLARLEFFRNSWIVRESLLGTPLPVMRHQLGFSRNRAVREKVERLFDVPRAIRRILKEDEFESYI